MKKKTTDEIDLRDLAKRKEVEEKYAFNESGGTAIATSLLRGVRSPEDLMNYAKIDRDIWEIERTIVNKWPMGYVDKSDDTAKEIPLYQVKVWLKKRVIVEQARSIIKAMLDEFKKEAPKQKRIPHKVKDGHLLEISIYDLHLGKLAWAEESGENYDLKITQSLFVDALEKLIERASGFKADKVLFVAGNDYFNADGMSNTTTAGTPQDCDGRWAKIFAVGRKLMVDAINRLREIAPVEVVMVQGNHDQEKVHLLGEVLSGWFRSTADVHVDNSPSMRKYFKYGNTLLGFTHGNEEGIKSLPLIMATERPEWWSQTKFREFHIGHFHSKKDMHFFPTVETSGIRVRQIPSLSANDAWHSKRGYRGLRAAEAYLWDKSEGNVGTFSYSPK